MNRMITTDKKRSLAFDIAMLFAVVLVAFALFGGWYVLNTVSKDSETRQLAFLTTLANTKTHAIDGYFQTHLARIKTLSTNIRLGRALLTLSDAFASGAEPHMDGAMDGFFREFQARWDYYDLFLIDKSGNVIYTLQHEADFLSNLNNGPYQNTGLAQVFKQSLNFLQTTNSTYAWYEPSHGAAAFLATPVIDANGDILGVVALQLNTTGLNDVISSLSGLGETGEVMVGREMAKGIQIIAPMRFDADAAFHRTIALESPMATSLKRSSEGFSGKGRFKDWRGI
ncbi:MAG: cache domain-containing protein, partial [Mariprofundus sp.]